VPDFGGEEYSLETAQRIKALPSRIKSLKKYLTTSGAEVGGGQGKKFQSIRFSMPYTKTRI